MSSNYVVGKTARISATFVNSSSVATDPTTTTLKVKDPSGNVDTYTYGAAQITRDSAGVFRKDISLDEAGLWAFSYIGTGDVATADQETINVMARLTG